jgi:hypothetical protein
LQDKLSQLKDARKTLTASCIEHYKKQRQFQLAQILIHQIDILGMS